MLAKPKNNEILTGNQKFKGFCIDLIEKIASLCNFTYEIIEVYDGLHGSYSNITMKWNGLIGEIIEKVTIFLYKLLFKHNFNKVKFKFIERFIPFQSKFQNIILI
jgi:hypothetical protein